MLGGDVEHLNICGNTCCAATGRSSILQHFWRNLQRSDRGLLSHSQLRLAAALATCWACRAAPGAPPAARARRSPRVMSK